MDKIKSFALALCSCFLDSDLNEKMRLSNRLAAASGVSGLPMAEGSLPGRCKPPFSWLPIGEQSGSSNITCVQEPPKPTEWMEVRRSEVCGHGTASSRIYEFVSYVVVKSSLVP